MEGDDLGPRLPRIFVMWTGIRVSDESASVKRNSCPPPSSVAPSIWTGGSEEGEVGEEEDMVDRV